ncbi:cytochrome ubiquinol oxidase subunit I [Oleisolibacter albus]|uniref:cytochrome ubiquinol oxidase subunit I n=1 Tax=Oleisolibacter albus TaxID=2171757 RepID=UPI000DF31AB6|nr:cytochrome ubiquinol oxidase subunit I [Oleisolibacter albus]
MEIDLAGLSRLQFAMTAMYHFLFVPLTLGLSFLLAVMETVYVLTGRQIWRDMTKFWGKLFGINFAMGVATGITMEFQFGTNWAYYSHYVGDIFGVPLAVEGLMAFFLESTFVGLFFFGWDRMSRVGHLTVTWLVAIGSNLSALWILVANGWMQNPAGAVFNPETMRMELVSFYEILFNPVAQAKFVHTVSAGYVTGAMFMLSVSAWYLLHGRHREFARRSMTVAASFGLAASLSVVVLGDESGYALTEHQKMKLAAIEAMWETEPAPADFTLFGLPDMQAQQTRDAVKIPYALGLIATRSLDQTVPGIKDLVARAEERIRSGLLAYDALQAVRADRADTAARERLTAHAADLGYALLLKAYVEDPRTATPAQIAQAAQDTVPHVPSLFWTFRLMVGLGFYFILLFAAAFWFASRRQFTRVTFLKLAAWSLPLPWLAAELGWFVAEHGRQPWSIEGVLPTFLSTSTLTVPDLLVTVSGFILFYSTLAVVEVFLLVKTVRLGPVQALGLGDPARIDDAHPQAAE